MSPEPSSGAGRAALQRVALHAPPVAAHFHPCGLTQALERLVESREASAREAGRREGRREAQLDSAAALEAAVARLDSARAAAADELSHTAVDLAVEVARALLRVEIPAGRYDLEGMVRESLSFSSVERGRCVVHLNPADAASLQEVRFRAGTEIEADAGVPRGSVHVTTPQGLLVRDLDEALRSIAERLHEEIH